MNAQIIFILSCLKNPYSELDLNTEVNVWLIVS